MQTVDRLDEIAAEPGAAAYIRSVFGSVEKAKIAILGDYFRHGFDGSGDDGGSSCVYCLT